MKLQTLITVLGSGTSTGVPMVGCGCRVCSSLNPKDKRTRSSLLLSMNSRNILIDTSTDLRQQALREKISKVDAVLYTHDHADHVNGIDDMRGFHFLHKKVVPCYGSLSSINGLKQKFSYIFAENRSGGYAKILTPNIVNAPFELFGINFSPVFLPHGSGESTGYIFGKAAYLTDCSKLSDVAENKLQKLDLLLLDGLRYSPHPNHFNIASALEVVSRLNPNRTVLTHLTHEVSADDERLLPKGVEFAFDGMKIEIEIDVQESSS